MFVEIRQRVVELVFFGKTKLDHGFEYIFAAGKIHVIKPHPEVEPPEGVVVCVPPNVEVPVGQFQDGKRKYIQPLFHRNFKPNEICGTFPFFKIDACGSEKPGIEHLESVLLDAPGQCGERDGIAFGEIQFP